MRLNKILLSGIVFMPLLLKAQGNFKPGYVVTSKGDTVKGFIDYREWLSSPDKVSFRTGASDSKVQKFGPSDIALFNIEGLETYQSYSGPISMDKTDANHVSEGRDTSFVSAMVFLKTLQKGSRVSLYSYTDEIKTRLFIKDNSGTQPNELIRRVYYSIENQGTPVSSRIETDEKTYIRQLFALAEKYKALDDKMRTYIEHAGYYEEDILKIVSRLNGVSEAEYKAKYGSKFKLNLVVGAGLDITSTQPFGAYQKAGGVSNTSYFPVVSAGADFFANPETKRLAFRMELMLTKDTYRSSYIYTGSPYVPVRYSYDQFWTAIIPQVAYSFYNSNNVRAYAGLGLAVSFYSYSNATYDLDYQNTKVTNAPINAPGFLHTSAMQIMVKAGVVVSRNWGIFVNYFTPSKVSIDSYFQIKTHPMQAGVNYYF